MPTLIMPKEAVVRKFHRAVWLAAIALAGLVGFPLNPIAAF
jgi:hypothetical protein